MRGIQAFGRAAIALLAAFGSALVASDAMAISAELKCQDTIAVQGRNYFKSRYTAISKCEDKKSKGDLMQAVNCRPDVGPVTDPATLDKITKANTKLGEKLDAKCTDPIVAGLTLGLPCGTVAVATVSSLTDCLTDDAYGANADLLVESVYDDAGDLSAAATVLKCQKRLSGAARNYAKDRMTARRSCAKKFSDGKLDDPCPDSATRTKLDKALTKFRAKVLKDCTDAVAGDALTNLGFPCDAFDLVTFERDGVTNNNLIPVSERLVRCMAAAAAGDGDLGADTAYPLPDPAPFSFGVAAGDQTDGAFIAWTRTDGAGTVALEVATDDDFTGIVFSDLALTPDAAADNTVKVDVTGLSADTEYFYRFSQGADTSRTGRVRTAPSPVSPNQVTFVWTGDANAFFRPYTVLDPIRDDEPDLFLFIGDTIYGDDTRSGTGVATVRSDYHTKYKENRSDRSLRNVMAAYGTVTTWDDHEVTNDFWGTDPGVATQMAAGNQAFRDYMPIREDGGDPMRLYRSFQWGAVAEFFLIDSRQYRDAQAYITEPSCLDAGSPAVLPAAPACVAEINDPSRTYLGAAQKAWLKAGLSASTAKFKFVMNGPLVSALLYLPYDRWEGYAAERTEILEYIELNDIKNVVFLSTDIHALIVNGNVVNPGPSGGGTPEWVAGAIGMDPIFRELPGAIAPLVPTLPSIFTTITQFDIDRFNYGFVEVSMTEAKLSYRDNTGAVISTRTLPEEP
jgi:alkaline phosphatase D